jgi:hypothetical protein
MAAKLRRETRAWDEERSRQEAERDVTGRLASAHLVETTSIACVVATATCTRRLRFTAAGYGVIDGDRMLVPFRILDTPWDDSLKSEQRRGEIYLVEAQQHEETLALQLPPGYHVDELPGAARLTSPALDVAASFSASEGRLTGRRLLRVKPGRYPVETYPPIQRADQVYSQLRQRTLVLRRDAPR